MAQLAHPEHAKLLETMARDWEMLGREHPEQGWSLADGGSKSG